MANAFVRLQGSFPPHPAGSDTARDDRSAILLLPPSRRRRAGRSDASGPQQRPMLHNVHSLSAGGNGFNVGQPSPGMVSPFQLKRRRGHAAAQVRRASVDDGVRRRRQPSVSYRGERHRGRVRDRKRAGWDLRFRRGTNDTAVSLVRCVSPLARRPSSTSPTRARKSRRQPKCETSSFLVQLSALSFQLSASSQRTTALIQCLESRNA